MESMATLMSWIGGDHDHGKLRLLRVNALQQGNAVSVLHDNVGQHQVEGVLLQDLQRFAAAGGQLHVDIPGVPAWRRSWTGRALRRPRPEFAPTCAVLRSRAHLLRALIHRGIWCSESCQVQCQAVLSDDLRLP